MPDLTPLNMLLSGLVLILLIILGLLRANRWHQARISATQYRTASGRLIDQQTQHIQRTAMATPARRVRAGSAPVARSTALHQVHAIEPDRMGEIRRRGELAALHDRSRNVGYRRSASPYTMGSTEYSIWLSGYLSAPQAATVQTTAHPLQAVDMEAINRLNTPDALAA